MPRYPWLERTALEDSDIQARMRALRSVGVPYTNQEIAQAPEAVRGHTEVEALIAYLQGLGVELRNVRD